MKIQKLRINSFQKKIINDIISKLLKSYQEYLHMHQHKYQIIEFNSEKQPKYDIFIFSGFI